MPTARVMENLPISGVPISEYSDLTRGLTVIKLAAARADHECGRLDGGGSDLFGFANRLRLIVKYCDLSAEHNELDLKYVGDGSVGV